MTINLTLMTRHIPLLLVLLCAAQLLSARAIQGTVLASNDSTAVAGATCRLLADGKLLSGASTDVNGAFLIETHAKSALNLEISMTGFSPTDVIQEQQQYGDPVGKLQRRLRLDFPHKTPQPQQLRPRLLPPENVSPGSLIGLSPGPLLLHRVEAEAGEDPSRESPSPCRDGRGEAAIRA